MPSQSEDYMDQRPLAVAMRARERARLHEDPDSVRISRAMREKIQLAPEAIERELRVWSLGLGAGAALMTLWGFNSEDPHHIKKMLGAAMALGALTTFSTAEGAEEFQKRRRS